MRRALAGADVEPERSSQALSAKLERATLAGMALGVALMIQPWWSAGMRVGFFVTALSTIAQIVLSHVAEQRA